MKTKKMRGFLHEFQYATGRDWNTRLDKLQLPDVAAASYDVRMKRDDLVRFRNGYHLLALFASLICGVEEEKLCPFDLIEFCVKEDDRDAKLA